MFLFRKKIAALTMADIEINISIPKRDLSQNLKNIAISIVFSLHVGGCTNIYWSNTGNANLRI
jgi:hypothetical protein